MDYNIIHFMFTFYFLVFGIVGGLITFLEHKLPAHCGWLMRYGKFSSTADVSALWKLIQIPKRWFLHFYIFAAVYITFVVFLAVDIFLIGRTTWPDWYTTFLNTLCGEQHLKQTHDPGSVLLALMLLSVHIYRRLYDTMFISVFSQSSMNLLHYAVAISHYIGIITTLAADVHGLVQVPETQSKLTEIQLGYRQLFWTSVFICAWCLQLYTNLTLAALRKNDKGEVTTKAHRIPHGGGFEYVSSPHFLAEILVYISICGVLGFNHMEWIIITLWVIVNQVEAALLSHWWYQEKFKEYPKNRKALIPFLL